MRCDFALAQYTCSPIGDLDIPLIVPFLEDSTPLAMEAIHAGVVATAAGGQQIEQGVDRFRAGDIGEGHRLRLRPQRTFLRRGSRRAHSLSVRLLG